MVDPGPLMATINNPLGLQADNQGRLPEFRVISMEGEGWKTRFDPCAKFCDFLSNQEHYTQKLYSLSLIIYKCMKNHGNNPTG